MEFHIPDMSCGGCANAIARAVGALDPTAKVDADVPVKIVTITSDLPSSQLIEAIEAAGFHPSPRG
ncbi:heavy-metal-associated domain-containing protein [Paraburkholderia xenovorans]|uniref:heavy-metal-associated domain-containing protein n=1 Tax=Paraburkholderia xenovorans TaxID=36873 RepID=UPI0038B99678